MAGKALILFVGSASTFALNGEPSLANQAMVTVGIEEEAEHMATTPLAIMLAPGPKETPRKVWQNGPN
jgi:hypothetical protein